MTDEPLQALEYDRTPPDYVSRRRYRLLLAFAIGSGALLLGGILVPVAQWFRASRRPVFTIATPTIVTTAAPRAPVAYTPPPPDVMRFYELRRRAADEVVYEEDPIRAMKLLDAQDRFQVADLGSLGHRHRQAYQPPVLRQTPVLSDYVAYFDAGRNATALFAGERTSPGGNRRLVMLYLDLAASGNDVNGQLSVSLSRRLKYKIFSVQGGSNVREARRGDSLEVTAPPGDRLPIRWVDGVLKADRPPGAGLRFFAGQPDPKDPSHFTVDYEQGTRRDTIDVWLGDDDFLRIVPRGGTVNEGKWDVTAGAAAPVEKKD